MSLKSKLSLAALCLAASGMASAATTVGTGSVTLTGTIGAATCTVATSSPSIAFANVNGNSWNANDVLDTKNFTFDFKDCGSLPNNLDIYFSSAHGAPTGTGGAKYKGGFNYSAAGVDQAAGPLAFQVKNGAGNVQGMEAGMPKHAIDLTSIANKDGFSLPYSVELQKANATALSGYNGTYSGSFGWTIEYP